MRHMPNLLSGLAATFLGVALILWIIPAQTVPAVFASVPSGFYPNITSMMLVISGIALTVSGLISTKADRTEIPPALFAVRFAVALILLVGAMLLVPILGFLPTGAGVCAITLLAMREHHWLRIAAICVAAPLVVWVGFAVLLGRPLP